jgi:hypothetical protein
VREATPNSVIAESLANYVKQELDRQDAKWGVQSLDLLKWVCVVGEENGEIFKAILEGDRVAAIRECYETITCIVRLIQALTVYEGEELNGA